MIKYATDRQINLPITLLYSGKNTGEMAFISEFNVQSSMFSVWVIETVKEGRIDAKKIQDLVPYWRDRTWWVCGPPPMVEAMVELAQKMGVDANKLRSEEFTGY